MKSCTSSFERGSSPVVGSSSRSRTGEVRRPRASATFCCMPRERFSIGSPRRSGGKPTRSRISGIRSRVSAGGHAVEARRVAEVLGRRHLLEERRLDGHAGDQALHGLRLGRTRRARRRAQCRRRASKSVDSRRTSVDFPEPFCPSTATHSPRAIVNVTPSSAGTRRRANRPALRSRRRNSLRSPRDLDRGRPGCAAGGAVGTTSRFVIWMLLANDNRETRTRKERPGQAGLDNGCPRRARASGPKR